MPPPPLKCPPRERRGPRVPIRQGSRSGPRDGVEGPPNGDQRPADWCLALDPPPLLRWTGRLDGRGWGHCPRIASGSDQVVARSTVVRGLSAGALVHCHNGTIATRILKAVTYRLGFAIVMATTRSGSPIRSGSRAATKLSRRPAAARMKTGTGERVASGHGRWDAMGPTKSL